jgi:pyridoxal phosphate enzyme (YggS family)
MGEAASVGEIRANIAAVQQRIERACRRVGRNPDDVTLIAVTKTQQPDRIVAAYEGGARHFGENYVQEALSKLGQPLLHWPDADWHFIGHLQSNKARELFPVEGARFALIQSVDSFALARELARRAQLRGLVASILLEVKLDPAPAKFGFTPDSVLAEAARIQELDGVELRGLMGMAPFDPDPEAARPYFQQLRELYARLPAKCQRFLSMGMTGDFETAIAEGATHVRIGTAIFGARQTS